jgi:hypothetical protein
MAFLKKDYYICGKFKKMRLGQLARKLDVKQDKILSFLEENHDIIIENHPNSKIEGDALDIVLNNFKVKDSIPTVKEAVLNEDTELMTKREEVFIVEKTLEARDEIVLKDSDKNFNIDEVDEIEKNKEENTILKDTIIENQQDESQLKVVDDNGEVIILNVVDGVIKAPKKELEGPKVVGKIDLDANKSKISFILTTDGNSIDISETILEQKNILKKQKKEAYLKRKEDKKRKAGKKRKKQKHILSDLELKEKQAELLVKKRIAQVKVDKNKKKAHYEQLLKSKNQQDFSRKKKRKDKTKDESVVKTVKGYDKEPKTVLGKIWKWFNT